MVKKSLILVLLFSASVVYAAGAETATPCGKLEGNIFDAHSGEGLGWTHVHLLELDALVVSHADGEYHFLQLPFGTYTLVATHVGYRNVVKNVSINHCDKVVLDLVLSPSVIVLDEASIKAELPNGPDTFVDPVLKKEGGELQRDLGSTIAETISGEAGISQRSMGPAPARPVLRGLSGDRLMLVEDGQRTGDLSATSADHAVAIEPLTAERVELIRGAESYLYTSSALGGIVNVKRNQVIRLKIHRVQGSVLSQYESVREGFGNALQLEVPAGPFAIRLDGSNRNTTDTDTPSGSLNNTSIHTQNGGIGFSFPAKWGVIGGAASSYQSNYGIPGGFIGAHPNGVDIDMERKTYLATSRFYFSHQALKRLDIDYDYTRYYHAEYESSGSLGMEFGVVTHQTDLKTHYSILGLDRSITGFWIEHRDYETGGFSNTPSTVEISKAFYSYHEKNTGNWSIKGSFRYDWKDVTPDKQVYSVTIDTIKQRDFGGFSGGFSVEYFLNHSQRVGVNLARSFKAPGVDELFSRGPHLAAYSFEIGNPNLNEERGYGLELFYVFKKEDFYLKGAIFINRFEDFIFPEFTGYRSRTRTDLYEYRYNGHDAFMEGIELDGEWQLNHRWLIVGSLSYVQGQFRNDVAMPLIPPMSGNIGFEWSWKNFRAGTNLKGAMAQNKLYQADDPDAIPEKRTSAWLVMDANVMYRFIMLGSLHVVTLKLENMTDTSYRNHLSRVKSVVPEPGRNFRVVYKVHF